MVRVEQHKAFHWLFKRFRHREICSLYDCCLTLRSCWVPCLHDHYLGHKRNLEQSIDIIWTAFYRLVSLVDCSNYKKGRWIKNQFRWAKLIACKHYMCFIKIGAKISSKSGLIMSWGKPLKNAKEKVVIGINIWSKVNRKNL